MDKGKKLNRWQEVNYRLFLFNSSLRDSKELRLAFLSGYNFCNHVNIHGTPKQFQGKNLTPAAE